MKVNKCNLVLAAFCGSLITVDGRWVCADIPCIEPSEHKWTCGHVQNLSYPRQVGPNEVAGCSDCDYTNTNCLPVYADDLNIMGVEPFKYVAPLPPMRALAHTTRMHIHTHTSSVPHVVYFVRFVGPGFLSTKLIY